MNDLDREDYIARYRARLSEYGVSPVALGWGRYGRQEVRFAVLAEHALCNPTSSVLDTGCGFADLYGFLREHGWHGRYIGVDVVPDLLAAARKRYPELELRELDITLAGVDLEPCDYAIASGVFNAKLKVGDNPTNIIAGLTAMWRAARVAVCVDFLSTFVDYQKPGAHHTNPGWAVAAARKLSRRIILRHDYMPYEFAITIFKDDAISERNVFQACEGPPA